MFADLAGRGLKAAGRVLSGSGVSGRDGGGTASSRGLYSRGMSSGIGGFSPPSMVSPELGATSSTFSAFFLVVRFRLGGSSGGASATSALSIVPTLSGSTLGTASDCVICSSRGRPLSISSISMLFAPFQFLMYQAAWGHFPASPLCRTAGVLPAAG